MIALLLLLQQGTPAPAVGDTVWVSRRVTLPAGAAARPREWASSGDVEVLGVGAVSAADGSAEIRYPIAVWSPGSHSIEVPGPLILHPGGAVDSIGPETVSVAIRSVLPDSSHRDSALAPQPAATVVIPVQTDPAPLLLWAGTAIALALVILLVRRRTPPLAAGAVPDGDIPVPPIEVWASAGEARAACEIGALRLRMAIHHAFEPADPRLDSGAVLRLLEGSRPQWPVAEIRRVLGALDRVRFGASGGGGDVGPLLDDVARLTRELEGLG